MKHTLWMPVIAVGLALLVVGCGGSAAEESESGPAIVSEVEGTNLFRIELTAQAAKRLDIRTTPVAREGTRTVVPYSAVLYSPTGETWVYVSPKPLTFVRHRVVVDHIDGERAVLRAGPERGATVATVGVAELFGAESGLGQ